MGLGVGGDDATLRSAASNRSSDSSQPSSRAASKNLATWGVSGLRVPMTRSHFRLYLDEVGTDALTSLDKDKHRYLSLTGVIMRVNDARDILEPKLNAVKATIFNHDPDAPLNFHRADIVGLKGPYGILGDEAIKQKFDQMMFDIYREVPYSVITALIDKHWMLKQTHWVQTHPYNYLMEIIVEKYTQFL